jgi:hypothetical protein
MGPCKAALCRDGLRYLWCRLQNSTPTRMPKQSAALFDWLHPATCLLGDIAVASHVLLHPPSQHAAHSSRAKASGTRVRMELLWSSYMGFNYVHSLLCVVQKLEWISSLPMRSL